MSSSYINTGVVGEWFARWTLDRGSVFDPHKASRHPGVIDTGELLQRYKRLGEAAILLR